jgi:peptidylprolyl isomerase
MRKAIVFLAVLVLLGACAAEPEQAEAPIDSAAPASSANCKDRTPPAPKKEDDVGTTKPDVEVPKGDPPCDLVIQDIHKGDGDKVKAGATVTIQYVGVSWSTGEEFDSSWGAGEAATFPLANLIKGWQEGIPGMKEGGRRQLIIPPDLAYGDQPPPGIAPNETLVFVIDLVKVL